MEIIFDLGMTQHPIANRVKRSHLYLSFRFGGQRYRLPNEGYMAYTIDVGGRKRPFMTTSIKPAMSAFPAGSKAHELLRDMRHIMDRDMLKYVRCVPQAKKLFIAQVVRKYKGMIIDAKGVGKQIFSPK